MRSLALKLHNFLEKNMEIKVKNLENGDCFIDIKEFSHLYDVSKIKFYELTEKDNSIVLKFFDKNKKVLIPNENR